MNTIMGIKVDKSSENETLERVKKTVDSGNKLHVVTLNTELLVASKTNPKIKTVINQAGLVIPESSGLYLADNYLASKQGFKLTRLLLSSWKTIRGETKTLPERLSGVDLSYSLAELCSEFGYKLGLLGGEEGVAQEAAANLKKVYPKLKIMGIYGGLVGIDDQKMKLELEKAQPDILLVAFGPPKQEFWIAENLEGISAKVAVGVGGTLDFMAGKVPRAPKLVRNLGMEWAFRLVVQPWRIKRQVALLDFVYQLLKTK